jgi:iron complex outermembrane recepter protein
MSVLRSLLLLPLLAAPLSAQATRDTAARRDTVARLDAVSVAVRAAYVPRVVGSAAAVSVRPDSQLLGLTAPTGGELLRQLPFLYVRQNARGETELSVRGSESRQAVMFFEGVPLTLSWDGRADAGTIPLAGVQQLDYVRGLSSLLSGPNAIGGVVSARLWTPHDPARAPERTTRLEVQGDGFGTLRSSAVVGGALAHDARRSISYRVGAGFRDQPGLARPGGVTEPGRDARLRLNTDARTADVFAGAKYEHAQGRYLALAGSLFDGARGVAPELHLDQPRLWRNPELSRRIVSLTAGTGALRSRLGVGDVELALGLNDGRQDIAAYATRDYREVTATERGDDRTQSLRVTFDQALGRRLVLRGAYTQADVRYLETIGDAPTLRYTQRLSSLATELDVKPTPLLTFTVGVAQDAARSGEAGGREPLGRRQGTGWRVGGNWLLLTPGIRLHASASERTRFPALRELYSGALNRFVPNPALRPERARSSEVGASWVRGSLDAQLVAFAQDIDDAVVRITREDRRFERVNRDRFRSRGVELTAGAQWGRTALRGDLTLQRARIEDPTASSEALRRPEDVPAAFGSLLATQRLGRGTELQGRLRALGETSCTVGDARQSQAGAATVDVGAEQRWTLGGWWRQLRATVQVENLLDRPLYDKCGLPQIGRTLRVGIGIG